MNKNLTTELVLAELLTSTKLVNKPFVLNCMFMIGQFLWKNLNSNFTDRAQNFMGLTELWSVVIETGMTGRAVIPAILVFFWADDDLDYVLDSCDSDFFD